MSESSPIINGADMDLGADGTRTAATELGGLGCQLQLSYKVHEGRRHLRTDRLAEATPSTLEGAPAGLAPGRRHHLSARKSSN